MVPPRTENHSPRENKLESIDEIVDPFNKPTAHFLSKTKRSSLINDRSPGPGAYSSETY